MRKLSWMIAAVLSTLPTWVGAVELGNARVDSHLTEHLKVVIPISGLGSTPLDEIKVRLAPQKFYDQSGLSLDSLAGNITFEIKEQGKQPVVVVHSKRIVTDPILSLLLEVSSGESQVIKEYDLLLNPPVQGERTRASTAPSSLVGIKSTSSKAEAGWKPVQNVPDIAMGGTYQVQRGDTLYEIARRATSDHKTPIRGMMQAIINANPDAFVGGDGNALRTGVTLKVPTAVAAATATVSPPTSGSSSELPATKLAAIDTPATPASSASPDQTQPKLELLSAEPKTETSGADQSKANGSVVPAAGATTATTADASAAETSVTAPAASGSQQTDEAIASIDAKSAAMSKQIELLNEQLKQVQGLVTERNQSITLLQQKVKQSEEQTQQIRQKLESSASSFWVQWGPYLLSGAGLLVILLLLIAVARGRKNKEAFDPLPAPSYAPTTPKINSMASIPAAAATAVATADDLPAPAIPSVPPFNPSSVIEEARLLVSYNLEGQAVSTLQDAIHAHPHELPLYQELAKLHSENHDTYALNQVLAEIEEKFGADKVPHLPAADEISALHGAVNIFDTAYDQPASDTDVGTASNASAPADFLDDIPSSAFGSTLHDHEPLAFEAPIQESVTDHLSVLDFDVGSLQPVTPAPDDGLALDLDMKDTPSPDEHLSSADQEIRAVSVASVDPSNDTRLGLVEAFLGVGDKESYQMLADEIESEGNAELISRLREIEQKFGHH